MYLVAGILLLILGIIMLWKPLLLFLITESWKHNGVEEPSSLFVFSTRLGGVVVAIVGIAGIIIQFVI